MRIVLHIGPDAHMAGRVQAVLSDRRKALAGVGVLYPRSPGGQNHTRLFMAATPADAPDALRVNRGFAAPSAQAALRDDLRDALAQEVRAAKPDLLILSAHQLGAQLYRAEDLRALRDLLAPLSDDIRILAHLDDPARMALRSYALQVFDGRLRPVSLELSLLQYGSWWDAAIAARPAHRPDQGLFAEAQTPPHWLDARRLVAEWEGVFGPGTFELRGFDPEIWSGAGFAEELASWGIPSGLGKPEGWALPALPPAAHVARARLMNEALLRYMRLRKAALPRVPWRRALAEIGIHGPPDEPGALSRISEAFAPDWTALAERFPSLQGPALFPDPPLAPWVEADPQYGFRATQYLLAFKPRIDRALADAQEAAKDAAEAIAPENVDAALSPDARRVMPPLAKRKFLSLQHSAFAPHNRLGAVNEEALAAPFKPAPRRHLPPGSTGNVIVGCMKNEAPYILEWVAYHRAIGIDTFVIYTNGCEDTTDPILKRLEAMGVLHHRSNEGWKGKSPQQHALNQAMKDPVVRASDWILHIDVDEYINVRCGNGTLSDFLAKVPDATHVAMTWRLFGHNGVLRYEDRFVTEQFDSCAPSYCPKPHTTWGFKTMSKNIGAYRKLSCHRPNQLNPDAAGAVKWVNGSGRDMTREVIKNGWRNTKKSIGYDLLQLNHYALRSAESFLVKRQRGRALHVDRSIGLNYWIRMDWSGARDVTIQRNLPRLKAEYDRLLQDDTLRRLHEAGVAWHKAKARELHDVPEFAELFGQAVALKLTELERAAFALALDLES